jgi:hypothetical protein
VVEVGPASLPGTTGKPKARAGEMTAGPPAWRTTS